MESTGFLKTVSFGGFDKKDVLNYVDELNTKIYTLEQELESKNAMLEGAGSANFEGAEKYEELLAADKAKISELQANNDTLKLQMKSAEDEIASKNNEIESLKEKCADLEQQLTDAKNNPAAASQESAAFDISNVFIEAQKSANAIVAQAKENAKKMDEDAKKLANQVVDEANSKAASIVKTADENAKKVLADAQDRSAEMRAASDKVKAEVADDLNTIEQNVAKLNEVLEMFSSESLAKLSKAKETIAQTSSSLKNGYKPVADNVKASAPAPKASTPAPAKPAPAPAPASAPAPAPAPAPAAPASKPAPKKAAPLGFDLSELENMAKAIEAQTNSAASSNEVVDDGYDGTVDPASLKLDDM